MSASKHVCAFYSVGPHYRRALEWLRTNYPDAAVTAWIPPGVPLTDAEQGCVSDVVVTELGHYSPADVRACVRLLRQIRGRRYDAVAVMFDSEQLQLLAVLSGARERVYITPRGRAIPLTSSAVRVVAEWLARRVWGRLTYAAVWLAVHCSKVKPVDGSAAGKPVGGGNPSR